MNDMNLEKELSKAELADEKFVNKAVIGKNILEHIRRSKQSRARRIRLTAASVAAVIMLSVGYFVSSVDIVTQSNERMASLPDGSTVVMQEHSQLSYNRIVWLWKRNVSLSGEARFVVAKGCRFAVCTRFGDVMVRGTEFTVKTGAGTLDVACFSGSVEVETNVGSRILEAGDKVECTPQEMEFTAALPPLPSYLRYSHTPLCEVVDQIERIYGVAITPASSYAGLIYDGILPTGNLNEALDTVLSSCGLHYTVSEGQVEIVPYEK